MDQTTDLCKRASSRLVSDLSDGENAYGKGAQVTWVSKPERGQDLAPHLLTEERRLGGAGAIHRGASAGSQSQIVPGSSPRPLPLQRSLAVVGRFTHVAALGPGHRSAR